MTYPSINPNNDKIVKAFEHINKSRLEKSLPITESWFQTCKHLAYKEHAAILKRAAKLMHAHVDGFAKAMDEDTRHASLPQLIKHADNAVKHAEKLVTGGKHGTGLMFINTMDWANAELPFGGIKYSSSDESKLKSRKPKKFMHKKLLHLIAQAAPA